MERTSRTGQLSAKQLKNAQKRRFYRAIFRFHFAPRYSVPHAENAVREETTPLYLTRNGAPFWFFRVWSTRYLAERAHLANEWCYPKHILLKMSITYVNSPPNINQTP